MENNGDSANVNLIRWKCQNMNIWIRAAERDEPKENLLAETLECQMEDGLAGHKLLTILRKFIDELVLFQSVEMTSLNTLMGRITDKNNCVHRVLIKYHDYLSNRLQSLLYNTEVKFHRSVSALLPYDDHLLNWLSQQKSLEIYTRIENSFIPHPVLFNDVVLRNAFSYLRVPILKECRLVCQKWNTIVKPTLTTKVAIRFTNRTKERTPADWNGSIFRGIEFCSFTFQGYNLWDYGVFKDFVIGASRFITELTLDGISFHKGKYYEVDITSLLANHSLRKFEIRRRQNEHGDRLRVSLDKLISVKFLTLQNCTVLLNTKSSQIRPQELEFSYVRFIQDEIAADAVLVNQFVNLKEIDSLTLCDIIDNSLVVDLTEKIQAKSLKLSKTLITDWDNSRWTVENLEMNHIHFREKTLLKVQNLIVRFCEVNLSVLPENTVKLSFEEVHFIRLELLRSRPISLPLFNYFQISGSDLEGLTFLNLFAGCPKLKELRLESKRKRNLDLKLLPVSIDKLTVVNIRLVGDTSRKFQIVRLLNQPLGHVKYTVTNFSHTETLIVQTCNDIEVHENNKHYDEYNIINLLDNAHFKTLILGQFEWKNNFWESPLCDYFDREAKYYIIENYKAKAIEDNHFQMYLL